MCCCQEKFRCNLIQIYLALRYLDQIHCFNQNLRFNWDLGARSRTLRSRMVPCKLVYAFGRAFERKMNQETQVFVSYNEDCCACGRMPRKELKPIYGRAALTVMAPRHIINCSYADPSTALLTENNSQLPYYQHSYITCYDK